MFGADCIGWYGIYLLIILDGSMRVNVQTDNRLLVNDLNVVLNSSTLWDRNLRCDPILILQCTYGVLGCAVVSGC